MNGKICQLCQQKPAKLHITQLAGGEVSEFHVCSECAVEQGLTGPVATPVSPFPGLGTGQIPGEEASRIASSEDAKTCSTCGQTFRGFRESGRLGCPNCYEEFEEDLRPLLQKVQAGMEHIGKFPSGRKTSPSVFPVIQEKRDLLRKAVIEEDFESAARLRDEIRGLEAKPVE